MREYIKTGNCETIISIIAENNAEVYELLWSIKKEFADTWNFISWILTMDDMNIRGNQLYVIYEHFEGRDIKKTIQDIYNRNETMIEFVNSAIVENIAYKSINRLGKYQLPSHVGEIWIIDSSGQIKLRFDSYAELLITDANGNSRISTIRYLNDYFFLIDNVIMNIWEFAEIIEKKYKCTQAPLRCKKYDILYKPPKSRKEIKAHKKWLQQYNT